MLPTAPRRLEPHVTLTPEERRHLETCDRCRVEQQLFLSSAAAGDVGPPRGDTGFEAEAEAEAKAEAEAEAGEQHGAPDIEEEPTPGEVEPEPADEVGSPVAFYEGDTFEFLRRVLADDD